jgi:ABC-type transporter Mla maintaining outer membrane lipid asymmetry permease subunit MlaE
MAVSGTSLALSGLDRRIPHAHHQTRLTAFLTRLNDAAKSKVLTLQEYFVLAGKSLRFIFSRPFYGQDVVQQMDEIGVKSLGIVLLTGLFTGMVGSWSRDASARGSPRNSDRCA